ncbi:MAG TPA: hypothetical protein VKA54_19940 [Gemmatimonadaceae bacterium]|nr:hypothetical protein [Gemmatimonadaceae bacterium]
MAHPLMRIIAMGMAALLLAAPIAGAQDSTAARSKSRQDSIAKAVRDSIALMKELGGALAAPAPDSANAATPATPQPSSPQGGPSNPRLLPDVSVVGDLMADLSPDGSTQEDRSRLGVREVEVTLAAVVDPYFRGEVLFGYSDAEGVAIETAQLITTALPAQLEAHLGRFFMPFGKQITTHRHDLHTIEYPYVIQGLFGPEGMRGTGVWVSRVFSPLGFYQELNVTAIDRVAEDGDLNTTVPVNRSLGGLGYAARLRNYLDINEASNLELSFSALTGRRAQPLAESYVTALALAGVEANATAARQTTVGADFTYRWRPLQEGLYRSLILQAEVMHQANERDPRVPSLAGCTDDCRLVALVPGSYAGPTRGFTGAYAFGRYQTTRRSFLGTRFDYLQDPANDGRTLTAGSGYLEYFPSEFSKLIAGYEAVSRTGDSVLHRILLQAVFALGPHRPHPF